jgi:hypothetical protein
MTALHEKLASKLTKALKSDESYQVILVFYNHNTRILRVIYRSGSGYDYFGVPHSTALLVKELSSNPRIDIRSQLKATYKRERLDSNVTKAFLLAIHVQNDIASGMRIL